MAVPRFSAHTAAVLVRLATTGLPVGDARRPDAGGWQGAPGASVFVTYLVCYPLGVTRDGPNAHLANNHSDPELRYQITSVGADRRSAETAADLAASALLSGVDLAISGATTVQVRQEMSIGITRDEDVNPPVFYGVDRYRLDTN